MPIHTRWYDDAQTIVLHVITGGWTIDEVVEELYACAPKLGVTRDNIPTYYVLDMRQANTVPQYILHALPDYKALLNNPDSITVIVGASRLTRLIAKTIQRLGVPLNSHFVDTMDDAEALIAATKAARTQEQA
jgi:hypothetical protein